MAEQFINLTPDPKVLIALTHTDIKPLDALCELIDNSIDSFSDAKTQGISIVNPCIRIELPSIKEINNNQGVVRISDNGPGLSLEATEKALRAGYSGNNPYDRLGLFGMGFNISTGKMGSVTKFCSYRNESDKALEVTIDLNEINANKNYNVPAHFVDKVEETHGTVIEVSNWWPVGNDNRDFIKNLVNYGNKKIRDVLGRRYSTILKEGSIKLFVNEVECTAYEHCVWGDNRYVERSKHGKIPAVYRFNEVIHTQKKCAQCKTNLEPFQNSCPFCGCSEIKTLEERISGWVGIQRFDDLSEFGIDLIRNGRAIRISEKTAFFEFTDEFQKSIKDYPIDSNYGRIVGEVHLDHVPVDFMKQDFNRTSSEWHRAMVFLRGESSLQPTQPGAEKNESPIYKLFQGYRKVKTPGKTDLYMGYWDPVKEEPHRISREVEMEFYERFKRKEPGYYDDAEWWKKVEEADSKPVEQMPLCPTCGCQNLAEAEVCVSCGMILKGKKCVSCGVDIPLSAKSCPQCGNSQEPKILKPWTCNICGATNDPSLDNCKSCGSVRGEENHLTLEYLKEHSEKNDLLSIEDCSVELANGKQSGSIKVAVYETSEPIMSNTGMKSLPIYTDKTDLSTLSIFINLNHKLFIQYKAVPEMMVAEEIAEFIIMINRAVSTKDGTHSIPYIAYEIVDKYWSEHLDGSANNLENAVNELFVVIRDKLIASNNSELSEYFDLLNTEQQKEFINEMINAGEDISRISEYKANGTYIKFVPAVFFIKLFELRPEFFFDGKVWDEPYCVNDVEDNLTSFMQERTKALYKACLDDLYFYIKYKSPSEMMAQRTTLAIDYLKQKVAE